MVSENENEHYKSIASMVPFGHLTFLYVNLHILYTLANSNIYKLQTVGIKFTYVYV